MLSLTKLAKEAYQINQKRLNEQSDPLKLERMAFTLFRKTERIAADLAQKYNLDKTKLLKSLAQYLPH